MRLALAVVAFTFSALPAFAQGAFEIQRPSGNWQQPREFQQPSGHWQVPGPIQTPRWLASHTTHAPRSIDRRSTAVGDARFDVDKSDLRFGAEEVLGRPDREAHYRGDRPRR